MNEEGAWPVTSDDDGSLSMTPRAAVEFMRAEVEKEEEEDVAHDHDNDDDLDDMA